MITPDLKDIYAKDEKINAGEQTTQQTSGEQTTQKTEGEQTTQKTEGEQKIDFKKPGINDPLSQEHIPGIDNTNPKAVEDYLAAQKKTEGEQTTQKTEGEQTTQKTEGEQTTQKTEGDVVLPENFIADFNKKANTSFKSIDEVYSEIATVQALRESEQALKDTVANHVNPFAEDEELGKIYQFRKDTNRSMEDYNLINGVKVDEMSSIDALVLQTVLSNPEYKGKEDLVRDSLLQQYKMDDDTIEGRDLEILQMNVDMAAKKAKQDLTDLQSKITVPDFSKSAQITEDQKLQIAEDAKMWEDTIPGIADSFSKFPVYASSKDIQEGKDHLTEIEIPADVRSEYGKVLSEYVKANNIPPTKKNVEMLSDMMHRDYISNNYLDIANAYANKKVEENNAMWSERSGQSISKMREQHIPGSGAIPTVADFNKNQVDKVLSQIPK